MPDEPERDLPQPPDRLAYLTDDEQTELIEATDNGLAPEDEHLPQPKAP